MTITMKQANTLMIIKEETGADITEHSSLDSFALAALSGICTETLEDITRGLVAGLDERMVRLAAIELQNRQ